MLEKRILSNVVDVIHDERTVLPAISELLLAYSLEKSILKLPE